MVYANIRHKEETAREEREAAHSVGREGMVITGFALPKFCLDFKHYNPIPLQVACQVILMDGLGCLVHFEGSAA